MRFIIFVLCIFSLTVTNLHANSCSKDQKGNAIESNEQKDLFEFKFTDEELIEVSKWKNKSFDDMWNDAFNCDRAALYMIGMSFLTGSKGLTIDVQKADLCFLRSSSFGFAPAIKQVIHKYIEEENYFLILVYSNLMTSLGHSEYIIPYHELRTKAMNAFGNGISKEIERIAACKKEQISKNIEKLDKSKDKSKMFVEMSYDGTLIDHQDKELNHDYWIRFTKFQTEAEDEAQRFQLCLINDCAESDKMYEKSRINVKNAIDELDENENANKFKLYGLKDAKKGIAKTEECIILMESFLNASNENLRKLAKEVLLLLKNEKGLLEMHYRFFLSPDEFLESDILLSKLSEYTAGLNQHKENIKELLEKLNNVNSK